MISRVSSRPVLGIAISSGAIRAILLRGERIAWHRSRPLGDVESLREHVEWVLDNAPRARWSSAAVSVAIGPAHSQLRRLRNLPAVRSGRHLADIVQQSAGRYFLQNGVPVLTTDLVPTHDGDRWAGAIEAPFVSDVIAACHGRGFDLARIGPTAGVLGFAVPSARFTWFDGDIALETEYDAAQLKACRRLPATTAASPPADHEIEPALRTLADRSFEFADAYAAARAVDSSRLAIRATALSRKEPSRVRLLVASMACVAAIAVAMATPIIVAARREHRAVVRLAALRSSARVGGTTARELSDSVRLLGELGRFRAGSPSTLLVMAALTRALEAPVSLISLRLDEGGGTLTALTPSTATLLEMLEKVPDISGPAIAGAVTPEVATPMPALMAGMPGQPRGASPATEDNERQVRVMIRFHWKGERMSSHGAAGAAAR